MTTITGPVVEWATRLVAEWGIGGIAALMLLESACIPIPSEAIMLFAGFVVASGHMPLWAAVTAGVSGNVAGSWVAYAAGRYGGRPFVLRWGKYVLLSRHKLELAERWFARHGAAAVFFSRMLPVVRTFVSVPAGTARMPFWKFTFYTAVGCVPWVLMLTMLGVAVGTHWAAVESHLRYFDYVVAACILALAVWWLWHLRRKGAGNPRGQPPDGRPLCTSAEPPRRDHGDED